MTYVRSIEAGVTLQEFRSIIDRAALAMDQESQTHRMAWNAAQSAGFYAVISYAAAMIVGVIGLVLIRGRSAFNMRLLEAVPIAIGIGIVATAIFALWATISYRQRFNGVFVALKGPIAINPPPSAFRLGWDGFSLRIDHGGRIGLWVMRDCRGWMELDDVLLIFIDFDQMIPVLRDRVGEEDYALLRSQLMGSMRSPPAI